MASGWIAIAVTALALVFVAGLMAKARRQTPALHRASYRGSTARVMRLLGEGADPDAQTPAGFTPLHLAGLRAHVGVVELLLGARASVDLRNIKGNTPLHCAAETGAKPVAEALLRGGADPDARGTHGETPLHLAARHGHSEVVELLIDAGARADLADDKGWTPQACANYGGHAELAGLIDGWWAMKRSEAFSRKPTGKVSRPAECDFDVFLSYRTVESLLVRQVADQLISMGISVWFDEYRTFDRNGRIVENWLDQRISSGILRSWFTVVFSTSDYMDSDWCPRELVALLKSHTSEQILQVSLDGTRLNELADVATICRREPMEIVDFITDRLGQPRSSSARPGRTTTTARKWIGFGGHFRLDAYGWGSTWAGVMRSIASADLRAVGGPRDRSQWGPFLMREIWSKDGRTG